MKTYKFKQTAIKIKDTNGKEIIFNGGARHTNAMWLISEQGLFSCYDDWHEDGFIIEVDGKEEFFNRYQSTIIADKLGIKHQGSLISEDIW